MSTPADAPSLRHGAWATAAVEVAERKALERLSATAGQQSLCALSRTGAAHPAPKYHEGAVAALAEVRRTLTGTATDGDLAGAVAAVRASWAARDGVAGPAWEAYLDGGRDALDELWHCAAAAWAGPAPAGSAPAGATPHPADAAAPGAPVPAASIASATRRWSRRRTVATVVLTPVAFAGLVALGGGWAGGGAPLWTALVGFVAPAAAAVLATYVPQPGAGARVDLGCSPCAATAAATLLAAAMFLQMGPHQPAMALTALATVGLGLVQRLNRAVATCDT